MRHLGSKTSACQTRHFASALTLCSRLDVCATLESISTATIHADSHLENVSNCFSALRQLRGIRRSVSQPVLLLLVTSLILTRLDYGSATLTAVWPPAEPAPVRSQCSNIQCRALSVTRVSTTTSLICSVTCNGCEFRREYTTDYGD